MHSFQVLLTQIHLAKYTTRIFLHCSNRKSLESQSHYQPSTQCVMPCQLSNTFLSNSQVWYWSAEKNCPGGNCRQTSGGGNPEISSFWGQGYHSRHNLRYASLWWSLYVYHWWCGASQRREREDCSRNFDQNQQVPASSAAKAAPVWNELKVSNYAERWTEGLVKMNTNFLSHWVVKKQDMTDGGGWEDEKSDGEECSVIYVRSMKLPFDALERGNRGQEFCSQPLVVTRSGRVVKSSYLA